MRIAQCSLMPSSILLSSPHSSDLVATALVPMLIELPQLGGLGCAGGLRIQTPARSAGDQENFASKCGHTASFFISYTQWSYSLLYISYTQWSSYSLLYILYTQWSYSLLYISFIYIHYRMYIFTDPPLRSYIKNFAAISYTKRPSLCGKFCFHFQVYAILLQARIILFCDWNNFQTFVSCSVLCKKLCPKSKNNIFIYL